MKKYSAVLEIGFLLIVLLSGCASTSPYGTSGVVQDDSLVGKYLSETKKEGIGVLQGVKNSVSASSHKYEEGSYTGALKELNPVPYTLERIKADEERRKKMTYLERGREDAVNGFIYEAVKSIF